MKSITLTPRFSEKAYNMSVDPKNTIVVFEVDADANKLDVKRAVEAEHKVTVTSVRIANRKPKAYQRMVSKRSRAVTVMLNGHKKAYVTLKAGDRISLFGEEAAIETPKKETAAITKKTDKPATKSVAGKLNSVVKRAGGSRGGDK